MDTKPKGFIFFDVDKTVTLSNEEKFAREDVVNLFQTLVTKGYAVIPVTGKNLAYAKRIMQKNGLPFQGAVCENGSVYVLHENDPPKIYGENFEALEKLKELLGIQIKGPIENDQEDAIIQIGENENARVTLEAKTGIVSMFTTSSLGIRGNDPQLHFNLKNDIPLEQKAGVKKRFPQFISNRTQKEIFEYIQHLISAHIDLKDKLKAIIHTDGCIDILRINSNGAIIDKSKLVDLINEMYPLNPEESKKIPKVMIGDSENDIPALKIPEVYGITFENGTEPTKKAVLEKGSMGFVSPAPAPEGIGIFQGVEWLISKGFFKENAEMVEGKIRPILANETREGKISNEMKLNPIRETNPQTNPNFSK